MKRPPLNLIVDLAAALLFAGMTATGYILYGPLPPGTNKSHVLWGLSRHQWGEVHTGISLALLASLAVHVALHWPWVVVVVRRQFGLATAEHGCHLRAAGVTLVVIGTVLVAFAWAARWSVRERPDPCCVEPAGPAETDAASPSGAGESPKWNEVDEILRASCLSCHGPGRARGGFRVDRRDDFVAGSGPGRPFVVPGDSRNSPLIALLSGRRSDIAFPDRHRLREGELVVIARWIDAGAAWGEAVPDE
jgi:mono/diheme cytochrome c family protein